MSRPSRTCRLWPSGSESSAGHRLLIISVGWLGPLGPKSWEYSRNEWERVFAVNLFGPISCVRVSLPLMEAASGDRRIAIPSSLGAIRRRHLLYTLWYDSTDSTQAKQPDINFPGVFDWQIG